MYVHMYTYIFTCLCICTYTCGCFYTCRCPSVNITCAHVPIHVLYVYHMYIKNSYMHGIWILHTYSMCICAC